MFRIIKWIIGAGLIIIQFFPVDRSVPEVEDSKDFIQVMHVPDNVANVLKTACYDCHSYQTEYPWYATIAPVSWWIQNHVNEGRHHLNFSEWGNYPFRKARHKLEECFEEVEKGEMPMSSYTIMHGAASLKPEQAKEIIDWFKETYGGMEKPAN